MNLSYVTQDALDEVKGVVDALIDDTSAALIALTDRVDTAEAAVVERIERLEAADGTNPKRLAESLSQALREAVVDAFKSRDGASPVDPRDLRSELNLTKRERDRYRIERDEALAAHQDIVDNWLDAGTKKLRADNDELRKALAEAQRERTWLRGELDQCKEDGDRVFRGLREKLAVVEAQRDKLVGEVFTLSHEVARKVEPSREQPAELTDEIRRELARSEQLQRELAEEQRRRRSFEHNIELAAAEDRASLDRVREDNAKLRAALTETSVRLDDRGREVTRLRTKLSRAEDELRDWTAYADTIETLQEPASVLAEIQSLIRPDDDNESPT